VEHYRAVVPALASLIALQEVDTAADQGRRRLAELPAAEQAIDARIGAATAALETARAKLQDSQQARRALEKDVAVIDSRLSRFDDHKAAVKTNQEYTALLHEIATAKAEKDAVEDRILVLMEQADVLTTELKADEAALAQAKRDGEAERKALGDERTRLEEELRRLSGVRLLNTASTDPRVLATYEEPEEPARHRCRSASERRVPRATSACGPMLRSS
jgi:predicted  nucleic acid-binding Zn-ribbon protein